MCLQLKSISSLAGAIRKASDSFRFLAVKSQGQAFRHFGKRFLFYLQSEEKKLRECSNCLSLRLIFSIFVEALRRSLNQQRSEARYLDLPNAFLRLPFTRQPCTGVWQKRFASSDAWSNRASSSWMRRALIAGLLLSALEVLHPSVQSKAFGSSPHMAYIPLVQWRRLCVCIQGSIHLPAVFGSGNYQHLAVLRSAEIVWRTRAPLSLPASLCIQIEHRVQLLIFPSWFLVLKHHTWIYFSASVKVHEKKKIQQFGESNSMEKLVGFLGH